MQQVSTQKFAEMCGVSDANIRNMLKRGTLNSSKDAFNNHLIDVEDPKNRAYMNAKRNALKTSDPEVAKVNETQKNEPQSVDRNISSETLLDITRRIEELAKLAGKAEQLEDNLIAGKKDVEYWRDLYFEKQNDCETLRNENAILKNEIERLKKPFWIFK